MCRGKKEEPPQVQYTTPPQPAEQVTLRNEVEIPYYKSKYQQYLNLYEPLERQIGGKIGSELATPRMPATLDLPQVNFPQFTLPEDQYNQIWQQGRERISGGYQPLRQQASERAAGRGMLGQGPTEKYFQQLDLSQAKSLEDMAVDMAIQQWGDKKQAAEMNWQTQLNQNEMNFQQQSQEALLNWQAQEGAKSASQQNALNFLSGQPIFTPNFPTSQAYIPPQSAAGKSGMQRFGGAAQGAVAGGTAGAPFGPWGVGIGAGIGAIGGAFS